MGPHDSVDFRVLFDHSVDAVFLTDIGGGIWRANAAACRMLGMSEQAICAAGRQHLLVQDQALADALAERARTGNARAVLTYRRGDGSCFPGDTTSVLLPDGASFTIVRDVSEARRAEEAIRERNEYIDAILEQAPIGFAVNTIDDGQARFVSRRFESIYDVEPGTLHSVEEYFDRVFRDPDVRAVMRGRMLADIASGDPARMTWENIRLHLDGEPPHYVTAINIPLADRNLMVSTVQDVTTRVVAQQALRARTDELDQFFELASDLLCIADTQGYLRRLSREWTRVLGWTSDELLGRPFMDFVHPDDVAQTRQALADLSKRHLITSFSNRYRCRDGSYRWLEWRSFSPDGANIYGVARDFTERHLAEQARAESDQRFERLIQSASEAIFVQTSGRFAFMNEATLRLLGATAPEQLLGTSVMDRVQASYHELFHRRVDAVNERAQPVAPVEELAVRLDGSLVPIEVTASPITYDGEPGAVVFVRDITERKRLEAELLQAQRMEAVGRLAGGVAHDFNNMLSVILGYAELRLSMMTEDEPARSDLEEIRLAATKSADLTRQLLAFARRQTLQPQVVDLNVAVAGTLRMLERLVGEDISVTWAPAPDLWPVRIDPSQVDQVLANLVVNARDAMPDGGRVTLQTANDRFTPEMPRPSGLAPGEYVQLAVTDTGAGMTPETTARVFDPFFTTKPVGQGTGLGLATVYGIVTQHGGAIDVRSEPGRGTTFTMWFPRHLAPAGAAPADADKGPPRGSETVLLVEDSPQLLKLASLMLKKLGYRVLTAGETPEALRVAETHEGDIDLLVTDVIMPEQNGREVARHIRERRPGIRVLYMSGYTADVIAHHGVLDEGMQFLPKPFTVAELGRAVRKALDEGWVGGSRPPVSAGAPRVACAAGGSSWHTEGAR